MEQNPMDVTIKYCKPCGYLKRAQQLADRVQQELGATVQLVPGSFGVFKVWVDNELIFDKRTTRGWLGKLGFGAIPADDDLLQRMQRSGIEQAS